jgi:hypothetical protein
LGGNLVSPFFCDEPKAKVATTRDYGKMEAINVQLEKIMFELESTYWQKKE